MVDVAKVKELRQRSNAPMLACKEALEEAGDDVETALVILQKKGILRAEAKAAQTTSEGLLRTYVHNGKIAVLVEINCVTDFVARTQEFVQFCDEIAMQIAATYPKWVRIEDIPPAVIMQQREIYESQLVKENKPEKAWNKIIEGKLQKWYTEVCLLDQESVIVEGGKTVETLRMELVAKLGENVNIRRFVRWEVGDNIQRRATDYAAEVARLMPA